MGSSRNQARTRRRVDRPKAWATPALAHARAHAHALSIPSGVLGDSTLLVALAASFGVVAVACLLVVIVLIVRNRRAARATDPASDVRTLLYEPSNRPPPEGVEYRLGSSIIKTASPKKILYEP